MTIITILSSSKNIIITIFHQSDVTPMNIAIVFVLQIGTCTLHRTLPRTLHCTQTNLL